MKIEDFLLVIAVLTVIGGIVFSIVVLSGKTPQSPIKVDFEGRTYYRLSKCDRKTFDGTFYIAVPTNMTEIKK